jgi:hypothetical protein
MSAPGDVCTWHVFALSNQGSLKSGSLHRPNEAWAKSDANGTSRRALSRRSGRSRPVAFMQLSLAAADIGPRPELVVGSSDVG